MTDRPSTATEPAPRAPALLRRVLPGVADLRNYHLGWLRPDLLAGLAVWAVLVPQGLAYGEHAGLSPVTGLYTALGALVLYALVGSSRYLHVGPESSVAIVTAAYVVLRRALLPPTAVLGRVAGHQTWRGTDDDHGDLRRVPGLLVYRFDAPLFFANADVLRSQVVRLVDESDPRVQTVVPDAEGMVDMDITGADALGALLDDLDERGTRLVLAHVPAHHASPAGDGRPVGNREHPPQHQRSRGRRDGAPGEVGPET